MLTREARGMRKGSRRYKEKLAKREGGGAGMKGEPNEQPRKKGWGRPRKRTKLRGKKRGGLCRVPAGGGDNRADQEGNKEMLNLRAR